MLALHMYRCPHTTAAIATYMQQFSNLDSLLLQLGPQDAHVALEASAKEGKPKGDAAKLINMLERRQVEVRSLI